MERKKYITKTGEEFSYLASDIKKGSRNFVFFHATGFNAETYKKIGRASCRERV